MQAWVEACASGKKPGELEFRIKRHDGTIRFIKGNGDAVLDVENRLIHMAGTAQDITERKQTEEALRASENLFRNYLEYAPDGVYMSDVKGTFLYGNRKCEEILGYRREELIGKNFLELNILSEKSLNKAAELLQENMKGNPTGPDELDLISKEGRIIPVEINTSVVQRMGEGIILAFVRDITGRKQAEEDLSLHVTRTQALLDLHLMATESQQTIIDFVLEAAQKACRSQFSFIGLMDETESFMTIHAWSKDAMAQCSSVDKPIHFPISEAGVWGDCVRQRKPVTINDYGGPWPSKKGYPEGHVPIRCFLSVPIFDGNKIVAVASVANKKEPYKEDDVNALISLGNNMWEIMRHKTSEAKIQQTLEGLRKAFGVTIQVMVSAIEMRDPYTAGHQLRVADLARSIATEMGLDMDKIEGIRMAGSIHDIGKLSIPSELLSKPTKLTNLEFSLIKEHSQSGYDMLKDVESPWPLAQIVYQHHERMDGSGYPRNLKGDEILMEARIMAVADVVEAMASHRPYRPGLGIDAALAEIEKNKGIFYDNAVAGACLKLFREKGYQLK